MADLVLPMVTVFLVLLLLTGGLAAAGDRTKFPGRLQGGGNQSSADVQQVADEEEEGE
ncbi:MAG: hypothetical protein WBA99_20345 [Nodosilinea sp.]